MAAPSPSSDTQTTPSQHQGQLLKSSSVVGMVTLTSRVFGLVRDILVAHYFGTRIDAFLVAFKIPNLLRRFFAEGAFANAFVPVLSEYKTTTNLLAVQDLVRTSLGTLSAFLLPLTLLGTLGASGLVTVFAPGFLGDPEKFQLTTHLLQITFPYLWLISLTAFASAVLNTYQHFWLPAATPIILNLSLIGFTLFLAPQLDEPLMALAWGTLAAGIVQCVVQLPTLKKLDLLHWPRCHFHHPGVKRTLKLMLPIIFGASVYQLNLFVDIFLASFLPAGSVTWLYFSDRIVQLPLGVIAVALSVVILPKLSEHHASTADHHFNNTLSWAIQSVWLIGLPATLSLILLAEPILSTLFLRGAMTGYDITQMIHSLRAYALGLLAFMMIKVLAPAFFARQDATTPVKIGIQAISVGIVLNFPLAYWFEHVGLALSTSLAALLNMSLLYFKLKASQGYRLNSAWLGFAARLGFANSVIVLTLGLALHFCPQWLSLPLWQQILLLSALVLCGLASYCGALLFSGWRPRQWLNAR